MDNWLGSSYGGVLPISCPPPLPAISPIGKVGSCALVPSWCFQDGSRPHPPRTPTPVSLVLTFPPGSQDSCHALQIEEIKVQEGCDLCTQT